ncbi:hypothetical protein ACYF6T_18130 [Streptomyces sp. 7R007]
MESLLEVLLALPDGERLSRFPGYRSRDSLRSHLIALRSHSPETYQQLVDELGTSSGPADDGAHRLFSRRPDWFQGFRDISPSPARETPAPASTPVADHLDFRDATFHGQVVGVQHHHYGREPAAPVEWSAAHDIDPLEFGVRPTRHVPGLADVPPYVLRDCDRELRDLLEQGGGLVLILGEPYAGKSYTAWNAVRSLVERGYLLHAPDPGADLLGLLGGLKGSRGRYVLWLDELGDHLGPGGLDRRLLGRLTSLGVVVLGTMTPEEYYRRRAGTGPGEAVLALARRVELPREWSERELARLARHTDDPRAYPAYMWSGREGAASYFAIGHVLYDEWQRGGTQAEHPMGQLLVRAVVDLARCGVTEPVPVDFLRRISTLYGAPPTDRESFEQGMAWATAPSFGISGLLVEGDKGGTWRVYGALVAEALGSGKLPPVPDDVWWVLLRNRRVDRAAVLDAARAAMRSRIEAGDTAVIVQFALCTDGAEREAWFQRAADLGDTWAAGRLGELLLRRGDQERAIPYLTVAAEHGETAVAGTLAGIYEARARYWRDRAKPNTDTVKE